MLAKSAPSSGKYDTNSAPNSSSVEVDLFLDCVHCGLCIPSCPTFLELGTEMDSPRGRIQLMRSIHEDRSKLDDATVSHLDSCLGCRACETVCPAGVRYGELIEETRHLIVNGYSRRLGERWKCWVINRVFPNPWMMRQFARMISIMTFLEVNRLKGRSWLPPFFRDMLRYLPDRGARFSSSRLAQEIPAEGTRYFRVGLLRGCVMPSLFGDTHNNTVKLLCQNGCDIHVPAGARCCGALLLHNGEKKRALALARQVVRAFDRQELDAIITNAAGCGAAMKEYAAHFANDPELGEAARRVSSKVTDIAEFLFRIPDFEPKRGLRARVTYHDACHLLNGQGIYSEPRDLMRKIPGVELVELPESDICCGSAGTYNLTQPDLARRLGKRKAKHIAATAADIVVTGNPGCILQIRAALQDRELPIRVVHTADLLAHAYTDAGETAFGQGREPWQERD